MKVSTWIGRLTATTVSLWREIKKYDLILVDIMLPEKRGNTIIEENRKSDSLSKDAKVIFMTNFQHNSAEREEFLKSSDGYFVKSDTVPRKVAEMIRDLQ
jgi:CheY-like chemotaxis protein